MRMLKSMLHWLWMISVASVLSSLFLSSVSFAAAVKACEKAKESSFVDVSRDKGKGKKVVCSITPRLGTVGDYVEIKNQYNYIVAVGRVIKQYKGSTRIVLTKYNRDEGTMAGYPVLLRINENQDYWTATNAPF